jgi:hypothetical protein
LTLEGHGVHALQHAAVTYSHALTYSWLLIDDEYETPEKRRAVKQLVRWYLLDGQIESHQQRSTK